MSEKPEDRRFVLDTSSIVWIRRNVPKAARKRVFEGLDKLVAAGRLAYPLEVVWELKRGTFESDQLYPWANRNKDKAAKIKLDYNLVREVLESVPTVLDPDKPDTNEADPYVLGLAMTILANGHPVTVVNEERRDRPDKLSITTACGILEIVALPMHALLSVHGLGVFHP